MSEQDFYEVEPTRTNAGGSEETNEEEFEQICYLCHRPERIAGKMIKIP